MNELPTHFVSSLNILSRSLYRFNCLLYYFTAPADEEIVEGVRGSHHTQVASALFPSVLCSAVAEIISLLDDAAVSREGCSVYEVAYQVHEYISKHVHAHTNARRQAYTQACTHANIHASTHASAHARTHV